MSRLLSATSLLLLACNGGTAASGTAASGTAGPHPESRPTVRQETPRAPHHSALDRILKACVRNERVDYLTIRRDHWAALTSYLDALARVDPKALNHSDRLAFYVNLYNASMIRAVIERLRVGWSPKDTGFAVFKADTVGLEGRRISLDALEHQIIRKQFKEPRIHVSLVCGALSCPPLLPRAYSGRDLESVLEANMRRFARDRVRNPIDQKARKLVLSQIFEWFADDFGGRGALPGYLSRYLGRDVASWPIAFTPYSWKLNLARPRDGEWVSVRPGHLRLGDSGVSVRTGMILSVVSRKEERVTVRVPFRPGLTAGVDASTLKRVGDAALTR